MPAPEPIPDLLKAANEASGKAFALWITFLTVGTYLAIAIGTTTELQLLLASPVKLPLLGVDLPLFVFYGFAPPLYVVLHLYVLMQLYLLARLLRLFDDQLQSARMLERDRRITRGQLDKFAFTQSLIGAPQDGIVRGVLRIAVWLSFVGGPVLLLLGFQLRFLPYHSIEVTYVHRVVLPLDLVLLLLLWPKISRSSAQQVGVRNWKAFCRVGVAASTSIVLIAFSAFLATVPGEQTELVSIDEARRNRDAEAHGSPPHALLPRLYNLEVRLIGLPILTLISERLIEPDEDKLSKLAVTLHLRGRDLQSGSFNGSDFRKADLSNTKLRNIDLLQADLRDVNLWEADLSDADMAAANLTGANLSYATLHNASLIKAILRGANLIGTNIIGADLSGADLTGAEAAASRPVRRIVLMT